MSDSFTDKSPNFRCRMQITCLTKCPFRFSKDPLKHHPTSLARLVSTLVRAEGWHSGGILSLSYAAGAWLLGSRYPRTTADTSHLTCAGLWADNSAHGDTARADDALTAAPHPSHHSCSVQFILMLIHAIDCGVMWSLDTPQLGRSTCSSQCLGVECPPPPLPLLSTLS